MQTSVHISSEFIWRRVHSLMGLWLVIYLIEHLLVNSQAALFLGDSGLGFVRMVNSLESLPFLHAIEVLFLGVPFFIHMAWGVHRAMSAKTNSSQLKYGRNRAFSWQRFTSWILLFAIVGHVIQMRFLNAPKESLVNDKKEYSTVVKNDPNLIALAKQIDGKVAELNDQEVVVSGDSPGIPMLLMVRDTFKNPWMAILYSVFVIAAAFHAFNGVWTALITWGVLLSYRSQKAMIPFSVIGMGLFLFLGFAAIFGGN